MKYLLFQFMFVSSMLLPQVEACQIKSQSRLISFSSTITSLLIHLNLDNSSQVDGLMQEHIKHHKTYSGNILRGGLVQSKKELSKTIKKQIIFYDQSKKLEELLSDYNVKKIKIFTRGKSLFTYLPESLNQLKPYLEKCEKEIETLTSKLYFLKKEIQKLERKRSSFAKNFIFFLGDIQSKESLPNMIISEDLFLKEISSIIPSLKREQNYSYTSEKLVKSGDYCFVGLRETAAESKKRIEIKKISSNRHNLYAKNIFLPGLDQLFLVENLIENIDYSCQLYKKKTGHSKE